MARGIAYALGGTNIDYRIDLAIEEYKNGKVDAVGFLGAGQGKAAARRFAESGIPPHDAGLGRFESTGYIVPRNDKSRTTVQSAVCADVLNSFFHFDDICICTEPYHGKGALREFRRVLPTIGYDEYLNEMQIRVRLKTEPEDKRAYGKPPKHGEAAPVRAMHEMVRLAFEPFYCDLSGEDGSTAFWDRDWHLAEAVYNPLRDRVESPAFELLKRSKRTPLAKRLARSVR